jgi:AhpD family alkylhydroperoxidase
MPARLPYRRLSPESYQRLSALSAEAPQGLDPVLCELVKVRVSQINGCAFCINMHTKALRDLGVTEQRIYLLNAWRDTPLYSPRERAALAWAETVTILPNREVSDEEFEAVRAEFSDEEVVNLTFVIIGINSWNRLAIPFRAPVVPDRPAEVESAAS